MGESTFFPYSDSGGTPTREDTSPGTQTFTGDDIFLQSGTLRNDDTQLRLTLNNGATVDVDISSLLVETSEVTGLTFNESNRQLTLNTSDGSSFSTSIPEGTSSGGTPTPGEDTFITDLTLDSVTNVLTAVRSDGEEFGVSLQPIIDEAQTDENTYIDSLTIVGTDLVAAFNDTALDSLTVSLGDFVNRDGTATVALINSADTSGTINRDKLDLPETVKVRSEVSGDTFPDEDLSAIVLTDNGVSLIGADGDEVHENLQRQISDGQPTTDVEIDDLVNNARYAPVKVMRDWANGKYAPQIDGIFLASTAAQRALNPPVAEMGLYSNINGTPIREHTEVSVIRGIRGIGTAYEVGDANETIIYDEWEVVSGGGTSIAAWNSSTTYNLGDTVYVLNSGVAHVYIYINEVGSAGMNPETPSNNTHWDAMGVDELIAIQNADGSLVEIHLARADSVITNPNSGMAVEIQNENVGHSSLLNWEASNGVLILNVDGLVDALANAGSSVPTFVNTAAWEAQEHISTDIDYYISTNDDYDPTTANADLTAQGYSDGDEFFIVSRDTTYQVISTGGNLALQFILTNRDSLVTLNGGQSVLDDILDNAAAIEANTQHNHEQDARIAALENQDFTTTISSFTESTTLSNLFTSGTIINKGNAGNNLYQAWTVTREGHELIGYLQLTDTERDSFRNEFSLVQGSSSNIYIPANPDAPHTIGIKAFPAADFNDLSVNTQVMLGQISSMRFGGNVGSETMFEIRWELINYSDAIDTGLGTVDSGEIYGSAGDKRYAFLAPTIYTAPVWEFREATVSRTEVITTGTDNALRTAPATVATDSAWLAFINGLGITGGGSTVRVDGVEVDDPNFIDNNISTTTARGVAFGADAQGNVIGQVDVTGLSGMGESALAGNTVGSLVKVNATQDGFDDAVAGTDYQAPLTADVDYQTPLAAGVDYQTPIQASDIEGVATDVVVNTWSIEQVENLDTMLTALAITDPSNIGLFANGQAYRIGDNFVEANTLYRVLSAGAYASFNAIIAANAAVAIGTFTINQTNNSFTSVTFTATVTNDAGVSVNLSNISYDAPTTTLTVEGTQTTGGGLPTADFERTSGTFSPTGSVQPNNTANWTIRDGGPGFSGGGSTAHNVQDGPLTDLVGRWISTADNAGDASFGTFNFLVVQTAAGNITLGIANHATPSTDNQWEITTVTSDLTNSTTAEWENVTWSFYVNEPVATGTTTTSSLNVNVGAAARTAVSATAINLSATSTVNDSVIITQELVDVAVGTGDFVIVDNVLQVNNGITSPGFVSFVRVNGFLGVRQEASDDTRDIYIVSYRGATHTVYFFKADSTWRSSDSTADNTNILTPLIGG